MCFKRKNKLGGEVNMIKNEEMKKDIEKTSLQLLQPEVDFEDVNSIHFEFGYLFQNVNHDIEALFKAVTDKKVIYLAIQNKKMMRLTIEDEEAYNFLVQTTLSMRKF